MREPGRSLRGLLSEFMVIVVGALTILLAGLLLSRLTRRPAWDANQSSPD